MATEFYVSPEDLKAHQIYFMVSFFDPALSIPEITTVVYLGRDIWSEGNQLHYFQDYESYAAGNKTKSAPYFIEAADNNLMEFHDFFGLQNLIEECSKRSKPGQA